MLRRRRALLAVPFLLAVLPAWAEATWRPVAPGGGLVYQVAVHPRAPDHLYAAAGTAGVYASVDGGESWSWRGAGLAGLEIVELALDAAADPPRLYAAAYSPRRLMVSEDEGASWRLLHEVQALHFGDGLAVGGDGTVYLLGTRLHVGEAGGTAWHVAPVGDPDAGDWLRQVAAHPTVPGRVVARTERNLWQSEDGGASWRLLELPGPPHAFAFAPSAPEVEYLSAGQPLDMLTYRSPDRGRSWRFHGDLAWDRILVDPFDAAVLYNAAANHSRVSRDAGATWDLYTHPFSFTAATVDPSTPGRLVAGSLAQGVLASGDGAASWQRGAQTGLTANRFTHLAFDDLGRLYASWHGFEPGRDLRRTADGWSALPGTPPVGPLHAVAAAPHRPWVIYAGGLTGLAVSRDDGLGWRVLGGERLGWVRGLHVRARGPLVAAGHGIHWSADGGETWHESFPSSLVLGSDLWEIDVADLVADPQRQNVLYAAVTYRFPNRPVGAPPEPVIHRSLDGGRTWRRFVAGTTVLAVAPSRPRTLYVAFANVVLASDDGGRGWRVAGVAGGAATHAVRDLEVDPLDPATVYAATAGAGVLRSRDGGATWEPLGDGLAEEGRLEVDRVRVDPRDPDRVYALPRRGGLFELRR